MKSRSYRILSLVLALLVTVGVSLPAYAAWEDFTDTSGHWAEPVLERAHEDGLINGFEDGTLRPDEPITAAQMATILCRVLNAQVMTGGYSSAGLSGEEWYAEAAMKALYLGLFTDLTGIEAPMTRESALIMMAKAFQISEAEPDFSALGAYSDAVSLKGANRRAIASLVNAGYVQGYAGSLNLAGSVSRAEFLTVLYRVAANYISASGAVVAYDGGTVISGASSLSNLTFGSNVWLDCSTGGVTLQSVTAPMLVIRSQSLSSLSLSGSTRIDRLVLASSGLSSLSVSPNGGVRVGTLVVGDTSSAVSVGGNVGGVEITGDRKTVTITGNISELVISGSGNTVTINSGISVDSVRILDLARANKIIINGTVTDLTDRGASDVSGSGRVETAAVVNALGGSISVNVTNLIDISDEGILRIDVEASETLPAGEKLTARALIEAADSALGKTATLDWSIDGELIKSETVTIGDGEYLFEHKLKYSRDMPEYCNLICRVRYITAEGIEQSPSFDVYITLENYGDEYYKQYDIADVLARVSTGYKGNYTLDWALDNDYDAETKTVWANAKGYSSSTQYLIWVSLAYQRVNIFEGSKENWELKHEFLCGSGAPGSPTPVGVYTVFGKQTGWFTSSYTVRPVVNFKTGSGYAFHSRLYKPGWSEEFTDSRIGFPVSHGCLRMYSEDITWMYNSIPIGTTVVVF